MSGSGKDTDGAVMSQGPVVSSSPLGRGELSPTVSRRADPGSRGSGLPDEELTQDRGEVGVGIPCHPPVRLGRVPLGSALAIGSPRNTRYQLHLADQASEGTPGRTR